MALTRPNFGQLVSNVAVLADPITVLHGGANSSDVDVGFLINRANGIVSNVAIYWDEGDQSFVTAFTSNSGATDSNISVSSYANLTVGNVYADGLFWRANGTVISTGGTGSGLPGGIPGQLQYNNDGVLAGANISFYSSNVTLVSTANITTTGNIVGGGVRSTTSATAPADAVVGDMWYDTSADVLYRYTFDGTSEYWLDIFSAGATNIFGNIIANSGIASTSTATGALQVANGGGLGVTGNVFAGSVYTNNYFYANGTPFTSSSYGNTEVAAYLPIDPTITGIQSNVATNTIDISNVNDTVGYYHLYANTAISSLATGANANTAAFLTSYTGNLSAGDLTLSGNLTVANVIYTNTEIVYSTEQVQGNIEAIGNVIAGNVITSGNVFSAGYFYSNGTPFTSSSYGNTDVAAYLPTDSTIYGIQANVGAFETYSNTRVQTLDANLGTTTTNLQTLDANIGAYETWANSSIQTIDANLGSFQTYANTHFGDSNYSNTNVAAYLPSDPTITGIQANIGAFETYANLHFGDSNYSNVSVAAYLPLDPTIYGIQANIGAFEIYANANAATQATAIASLATGANANTAAYLTTATGDISAGNLAVTGNVTATYFVGAFQSSGTGGTISGAESISANVISANTFTFSGNGINILSTAPGTYSNSNVASYLPTDSTIYTIQANVGAYQTYANANAATQATAIASLATGANANTAAYLTTATGNISAGNIFSAGYFYANGTPFTSSSYGNTEVAAYLPTFGGVFGNANIARYTQVTSTTSGTTFHPALFLSTSGNLLSYAASSLSFVPSTGLLSATTFSGAATLTTLSTSSTATLGGTVTINAGTATNDNLTGALIITGSGGLAVAGNVNLGNQLFVGAGSQETILTNPVIIARGTSSSGAGAQYTQSALINTTSTGSSDFAAYADNGTDAGGWVDMGVTGSTFSDASFTITKANDGYLFASGTTGLGGNLVLATDRTGTHNDIVLAVGSFYSNAEVARFHGNATTGGYFALEQGTSATSTTTGALRVSGGAGVTGNLYVGNHLRVAANVQIDGNLIIAGNVYSATTEILTQTKVIANEVYAGEYFWANGTPFNYGNVQVSAYLQNNDITIGGNLTVLGNTTLVVTTITQEVVTGSEIVAGNLVANSGVASTNSTTGAVVVVGGVGIGGDVYIDGNLNVTGSLASTVNIPASANQIYVAKNGSDTNNGTLNSPFLTIKAALAAAASGTAVHVAPGTYTEDNPVTIPSNVTLIGDNLRNVIIIPQTPASDIFYVTSGCYIWGLTIKNYTANGFSYNSSTSSQNVFVSPYIQNITSSTTTGTAVMVDGNYTSSISTKAMIVGFFTIINQGGYGVHLTNSAYSQLVNIYTIGCEVGIWCESGAFCTLNGSDNSVGNIGLRADGYGPLLAYGNTSGYSVGGVFVIQNPSTHPNVNQVMIINGDPNFYSIDTIAKLDAVTYQVTVQETYTSNLAPSTNIAFYQRSAVVASAHTFEYVGAGTVVANALPQYGGIPDASKEVVTSNGGRVTYTATDHKGNFKIGSNLVINQSTGTISGDSFSKSMFSLMTPYILALAEGP